MQLGADACKAAFSADTSFAAGKSSGRNFLSIPNTENLMRRPRIPCDPLRPRFAEQEGYSRAVEETFRDIRQARRIRI